MQSTVSKNVYHFLKIIKGSMFSGKTTQLGTELSTISNTDAKITLVLHEKDKRYTDIDELIAHNGIKFKIKTDNLVIIRVKNMLELKKEDLVKEQYVFVDELHFYSMPECEYLAQLYIDLMLNLTVVVLSNTCFLRPCHEGKYLFAAIEFPQLNFFVAMCTHVDNHVTACNGCKNRHLNAVYSYMFESETKVTYSENNTVVGGNDIYRVYCVGCYLDVVSKYGLPCINSDGTKTRLHINDSNVLIRKESNA